MGRVAVLIYGVVVYIAFVAVFSALPLFVGNLGIVRGIDAPPTGGIAVDLALIAVFGVTHSVLARPAVKRALARVNPPPVERSSYVLVASASFALLMWQWRALPEVVWHIETPVLRGVVWLVTATGVVLIVSSTLLTNHFDLFGLRQVWLHFRGRPYTPVPFVERSLYTRVRHPMMLGVLVWLWATPDMTVGHLVFAAGMSAYVFVGTAFEERELRRTVGAPYDDYRQRVRAFLPFRK